MPVNSLVGGRGGNGFGGK